jgi:hypothetical protein
MPARAGNRRLLIEKRARRRSIEEWFIDDLLGARADQAHDFVNAAEWTALVSVALLVASFAIAFWLPRRAREMGAPAVEPALA